MAGYTNTTRDAVALQKGAALEFMLEIHADLERALTLADSLVRASDVESRDALTRLRAAHAKRAEVFATALA